MCSEFNQINGKLKVDNRNLKITLVVENGGCLGVKTTKKEGKHEAKFALKLMCPKFNKIDGRLQGKSSDYEN